jgi:hypothetical protein
MGRREISCLYWDSSSVSLAVQPVDSCCIDCAITAPNYKVEMKLISFIKCTAFVLRSRDSAVGIATGYRLDYRGVWVRVPVGSRISSSPRRPDQLWGPPNLLSNGYQGLFPRGQIGRCVKLTIHLQLVLSWRKCGSINPLPHMPFMA